MKPKIVVRPAISEVEEFARFFHQDFGIMFGTVSEGANEYLVPLNVQRRRVLASELRQLLSNHSGQSQRGLLNTWRRLGAEYWNRKVDLRESLASWATDLEVRTD